MDNMSRLVRLPCDIVDVTGKPFFFNLRNCIYQWAKKKVFDRDKCFLVVVHVVGGGSGETLQLVT